MPKFVELVFLFLLEFFLRKDNQTTAEQTVTNNNEAKERFTEEQAILDSATNFLAEFKEGKLDMRSALKWLNENAKKICSDEYELKIKENELKMTETELNMKETLAKMRQNLCGQLKNGQSIEEAAKTVWKAVPPSELVCPTIYKNMLEKIQSSSWLNAKKKSIGTMVEHFSGSIDKLYAMTKANNFLNPCVMRSGRRKRREVNSRMCESITWSVIASVCFGILSTVVYFNSPHPMFITIWFAAMAALFIVLAIVGCILNGCKWCG